MVALFFKIKNKGLNLIFVYLIYCLISDIFISKLSIKYWGSEIYSYRLFTVLEFTLLSLFLNSRFESFKFRIITKTLFIIFYILIIIDFLTASFNKFDSFPTGIESIFLIFLSILLLFEKVNLGNFNFDHSAWISFALITFFSGTFFLFILSQNNFNDSSFSNTYGYVVAIFNIIKNVLISIGVFSIAKLPFSRLQKV